MAEPAVRRQPGASAGVSREVRDARPEFAVPLLRAAAVVRAPEPMLFPQAAPRGPARARAVAESAAEALQERFPPGPWRTRRQATLWAKCKTQTARGATCVSCLLSVALLKSRSLWAAEFEMSYLAPASTAPRARRRACEYCGTPSASPLPARAPSSCMSVQRHFR